MQIYRSATGEFPIYFLSISLSPVQDWVSSLRPVRNPMAAHVSRCLAALAALAAWAAAAAAQEPTALAAQFQHFAEQHCLSCHGPDVQRRKLRLDTLPATFTDKDIAATWVKVLDRLARGEMPPKDKPRPSEKDAQAVIAALQRQLH